MIDDFFSLVMIGAGFYVLYAARELKRSHRIIKSIILSPDLHDKQCKDMDGLVRYMFPRCMVLACVTVLLGVYELMMSYTTMSDGTEFRILEGGLSVAFFVVLIYYVRSSKRLGKMFY